MIKKATYLFILCLILSFSLAPAFTITARAEEQGMPTTPIPASLLDKDDVSFLFNWAENIIPCEFPILILYPFEL